MLKLRSRPPSPPYILERINSSPQLCTNTNGSNPDTDSTVPDSACLCTRLKDEGGGGLCLWPLQREGVDLLGADVARENR